jgi:hypothetical protein
VNSGLDRNYISASKYLSGGSIRGSTRTDRPPDDDPKRASRARSASFYFIDLIASGSKVLNIIKERTR